MQGSFMTWFIAALFGVFGGWLMGLFGEVETETVSATVVVVAEFGEVAVSAAELVCDGSTDSRITRVAEAHEDLPSGPGVLLLGLNTLWPYAVSGVSS